MQWKMVNDYLFQVDEINKAFGQDVLNVQAHLPDGHFSCGLAYTKTDGIEAC